MFKDEFIRKLAAQSGLSIQDTKIVWAEVEKIFVECIEKREPLSLRGLGHMNFAVIPAHKGFDLSKNEKVDMPEAEKLYFTFSRNLRDLLISDPTKRKIYQTRQAELRRAGLLDEEEGNDESDNDFEDGDEISEG